MSAGALGGTKCHQAMVGAPSDSVRVVIDVVKDVAAGTTIPRLPLGLSSPARHRPEAKLWAQPRFPLREIGVDDLHQLLGSLSTGIAFRQARIDQVLADVIL